jgi:hypothetical protein
MPDGKKKAEKVLRAIKVTPEDRSFFSRIYQYVAKKKRQQRRGEDRLVRVITREFERDSAHIDKTDIQEGCNFRATRRAREIAMLVVDEYGEVNSEAVGKAIDILQEHLYSLGEGRQHDIVRQEHMLNVLRLLRANEEYQRLIKRVNKPSAHKIKEKVIRDTLSLEEKVVITNAHARQAVLAAWLAYLRQNVGSCFATAPAIIIHGEQPERFLNDIIEMMAAGRIKRTFGGVEYSVPFSSSCGSGDLKRPFVLRVDVPVGRCLGIVYALQSAGIIQEELTEKELFQKMQEVILERYSFTKDKNKTLVVTSDEVIRKVLLHHNEITEEDIYEYENKPKAMLFSRPIGVLKKETSERCKVFLQQYELGKRAFKRVTENALLKSWEYTLASFAETKATFSRWNLYSSLGLSPDDESGIGKCIFDKIKEKFEHAKNVAHEVHEKYEEIFVQVKYLEGRINRATTEDELKWMKGEYQNGVSEMNYYLDMRDAAQYRSQQWAHMFDFLVSQYDMKFKEYFQEIYDADMHDITADIYDDSPAGFRLIYKHGRTNTSVWTKIEDASLFVQNLSDFFTRTENEIVSLPEMKGLEQDFSDIITVIVNHIMTNDFLESALYRMAAAHGGKIVAEPLKNMDKVDKKPWVYTSGGTMNHLVSCYYSREDLPTEEKKNVDRVEDLCAFLIDAVKAFPEDVRRAIINNPEKSMLMFSPTHAFVFKPGRSLFMDGWSDAGRSYTWVRDAILIPQRNYIKNLRLDASMVGVLLEEIARRVFEPYRKSFLGATTKLRADKKVDQFRDELVDIIKNDGRFYLQGQMIVSPDEIDSLLFSLLPMNLGGAIGERIHSVIDKLTIFEEEQQQMHEIFEGFAHSLSSYAVITAKQAYNIIKAVVVLVLGDVSSEHNIHREVRQKMREVGLAMPEPVIFADTNWAKEYFAFVVNPGSLELELWSVDETGSEGRPMASWKKWVDGTAEKAVWGIYTEPSEYGG